MRASLCPRVRESAPGSLNVHPCTCSELARILRARYAAFLRTLAAAHGAAVSAARSCAQKQRRSNKPSNSNRNSHDLSLSLLRTWNVRRSYGALGRGDRAQKVRRIARTMRASSLSAHGCAVGEPVGHARTRGAGCPQSAHAGRPSLRLLSLGRSTESNPLLAQESGSSA